MLCSLSTKLGETDLSGIAKLEKELGHPLIAFNCYTVAPASLEPEEVAKIQDLEARLGVSLVAVEA